MYGLYRNAPVRLRRRYLGLAFAVLLSAAAAAAGTPARPPRPYTRLAVIRNLPRRILLRHPPVRVRALAAFYAPRGKPHQHLPALMIWQPGGGLFVLLPHPIAGLRDGRRVEVTGYVRPGGERPVIIARSLRLLGPAAWPRARYQTSVRDLLGQRFNADWVGVRGVIRTVAAYHRGWLLGLLSGGGYLHVYVHASPSPPPLVDALIAAQGMASTSFRNRLGMRQLSYLLVPRWRFLRVVRPPPAHPFALPLVPLTRLGLRAGGRHVFWTRVEGKLILQTSAMVVVQSQHLALLAQLGPEPQPRLPLCSQVDVVGFPVLSSNGQVRLRQARARFLARAVCPAPAELNLQSPAGLGASDRRVRFVGRVLYSEVREMPRVRRLLVQAGRYVCVASLQFPGAGRVLRRLHAGSQVSLTGVFDREAATTPMEFNLLPASAAGIVLLRAPSWWSPRHLLWLLAALGLLSLLALAWGLMLRHQVRRQTALAVRAAEENNALEKQVSETRNLEMLARLAGGVAHEFNNLLTVIAGQVQCAQYLVGDEKAQRHLRIALDAGKRAARLTEQLLAYGRMQWMKLEPLDLNQIVQQACARLAAALGPGIELHCMLAPRLWPAQCDRKQVLEILDHLAANARDAMPGGGRFEIRTDNFTLTANAGFSRSLPGDYVRLQVRDNGPGLSEEARRHLFEPFYSTKNLGRGLGLASVEGILRQCGGDCRVQSAKGIGTGFDLVFPRALQVAAAVHTA